MPEGTSQSPAAYLNTILSSFAHCFSRIAAFQWFPIVIMAFIVRADFLGVTSFIRALDLCPDTYLLILNFFNSQAWSLSTLLSHWQTLCFAQKTNILVRSRHVLIGDHCYGVKEATRMPAVVTLRQNSETSSKPSYFRGHSWSFIALLQGIKGKAWAMPLMGTIDQGFEYLDNRNEDNSLATRIVARAITMAHTMRQPCYLILDAFFAVGPTFNLAWSAWAWHLKEPWIHIITRAKRSVVAYEPVVKFPPKKRGKGRPRKLGTARKLYAEYEDCRDAGFKKGSCWVYDKRETVLYQAKELYWKPIGTTLLFVMANTSRGFIILMSSDTQIEPMKVIELYRRRVTIEGFFSILKNLFGGFGYHFWSKYMDRQHRRPLKNKEVPEPNKAIWKVIRKKREAIERFVNLCAIAIGLCHIMTSKFHDQIWRENKLWLRIFSNNLPSVYMTKLYIANLVQKNIREVNHSGIYEIIASQKNPTQESHNPKATTELSKRMLCELEKNIETGPGIDTSPINAPQNRITQIIGNVISKWKNFVYHGS